jgi:D-alanine-D-alanine ligase
VRLGFTFNVRSSLDANAPGRGLAGDAEEEFDPPETIEDIAAALRSLGHDVELLGDGEPLVRRLLDQTAPRPDLVFNMAEGTGIGRSREARLPALLEMLGIPHTGSDPLTLAVALDKSLAKTIVAAAGVAVPKGAVVEPDRSKSRDQGPRSDVGDFGPWTLDLGPGTNGPVIAKPVFEGSSKGVLEKCLIDDPERLPGVVAELLAAYEQPVLVEEFIDGDELTVGVLGNSRPQVIGVMRIVPLTDQPHFVYSLEVKRDWVSRVRYECPAQISPADVAAVEHAALSAYKALGCRDVARIDFRLRGGVAYFIEANPLPGLSPKSSDIVILARAMGIEHSELLRRIIAAAMERYGLKDEGTAAAGRLRTKDGSGWH